MNNLMLTSSSLIYSILLPVFAYVVLSELPFFKKKMAHENPGKYIYLDPIRGIAAMLVFIHHSIMVYNQHADGAFSPNGVFSYESPILRKVYVHFGQASVMIFFMITGFLFFNKILSMTKPFDVKSFFTSRLKRLLPAMGSCFFLYIAVCYTLRDNDSQVSIINYIVSWFSFGFIGMPNLSNSFPGWSVTAGVLWTLVVEWKFYFLLPFLSVLISGSKSASVFLIGSLAIILYLYSINNIDEKTASIYLCFISGLAIALINKHIDSCKTKYLKHPISAFIIVFSYCCGFYYTINSYNFIITVILFFFMLTVVSGCSYFGLLKIKALHWAGKSSYSIYIMHAMIMHLVFTVTVGKIGYLSSLPIVSALLCLITLLNYIYVERRYMHAGKNITN